MFTATETSYTGTFHGRAEEVSRVRQQVARYLGDCPVIDDAVFVASEFAANAVLFCTAVHAGSISRSASNGTPITSGWNARMRAGRGEAGIRMTTGLTG
jgi:hypothetical protein